MHTLEQTTAASPDPVTTAQDASRHWMFPLTHFYEWFLIIFGALFPILAIGYIYLFQDQSLLFVDHRLHEIAIGFAILQSAFVSYVTWRCYVYSGEPLLRWLTLSLLGFTLIYSLHGAFTSLSHDHMALFLLYGPVSRFVMAFCLLASVRTYGQPAHPLRERTRAGFWAGWVAGFLLLDVLVAWVALDMQGSIQAVRLGAEGGAFMLLLGGIVFIFIRQISAWMKLIYMITLTYLALSSLTFLLAKPWNHLWWFAHRISAGGFAILSYGVIRAFHTTRSFALVFNQEEMLDQLAAAHAALGQQARHMKKILDDLFAYVALLDTTGVVQDVNKEPLERAGILREDVIGKRFGDCAWWSHDENARRQLAGAIEAAAQGNTQRYDVVIKMGADLVPVDFQISPVTDENGWVTSLLAMGVDITERKLAEAALRKSEDNRRLFQQQKLVQTSLDGFLVLRAHDAFIVETNDAFCEISGYSRDELLTMRFTDLETPESIEETFAHIKHIAAAGYDRFETCQRHKQGRLLNLEVSISDSESLRGTMFAFVRDITERKHAERMLKNSRDQLLTFIQQAPICIAMLDRDMNYLAASDRWLTDYGRGHADLIGRNHYEIHPDLPAEWRKVHQLALAGTAREESEDQWTQADGSKHWLRWAVLPWTDANGAIGGIIIYADDITAQKVMQAEIAKRRVERQSEMEYLLKQKVADQTAAAIAHEMNQPLLAIASYSDTALMQLRAKKPNFEKIQKSIEGCEQQAQRAGKSIRELLDFLRMKRFATEKFDLNQEILDVLNAAKSDHKLNFEPDCNLDDQLPLVLANRSHVRKVLTNLLNNGIEAMQEANVPLPSITFTVCTKNDESVAQVTIRDNGPGIRKEDFHRLFDPFFTTKATGIGMGLAISRSLMEENGGQLWVDPHEGPGAVFHLTLPFAS